MKKLAIVALVCVNVALLGMLVVRTLPQAQAQPMRRVAPAPPPNYMITTGQVGINEDVVYVIDVNSRRMAAWQFDRTTKRLQRVRLMRNLAVDFPRR